MKLILVLSLVFVASCGGKPNTIDYGRKSSAELIKEKGEPVDKESTPMKDTEIYKYPENEKFQVKNDVVTHGFRDPKGDEKTLLYWQHKFKDCNTSTTKIKEAQNHEKAEYELKCPAEGLTVIYSDGSEFVSRIIEHEKK